NLLQGRADVRTAARMGMVIVALTLAARFAAGWHAPGPFVLATPALGLSVMKWVIVGGLYLGLEPVVRRRWPWRLTGWVRLFNGRLRDPLVGRDVLIGLAGGLLAAVVRGGSAAVGLALEVPGTDPTSGALYGVATPAAYRLLQLSDALFGPPVLFLSM